VSRSFISASITVPFFAKAMFCPLSLWERAGVREAFHSLSLWERAGVRENRSTAAF
jgi:hypothetical protein